jgi:DNA polymerase bacteriophage-type
MTPWIVIDFETRSACPLTSKPGKPGAGADRYAEDLTTEVLCLCWGYQNGDVGTWYPGEPLPRQIGSAIEDGCIFVAHNVRFERAIWQRIMVEQYGWPAIPLEQWHDTMARCGQVQLPMKLEKVAQWLALPVQKDMEGNRLTLGLSRPDKQGNFAEVTPETQARVGAYCQTDIGTQVALHRRLGWLPGRERDVWLLDQKINDRGIRLDMPLVRAMSDVVERAKMPLLARFEEITGTQVTKIAQIKTWLAYMGVPVDSLDKEAVVKLIGDVDGEDEDNEEPPLLTPESHPEEFEALSIRQLVGSASVAKLKTMEACVCADDHVRGALQYHAAGPGRWGGRLFQPQNFPRGLLRLDGKSPAPDDLVATLLTRDIAWIEMLYGPAVATIVSSLRHTIIPDPGCDLVAGDFAGIEARFCLSLAGAWDKVKLMASGADVYCDMASQIYSRRITKADVEERQIGKNSVLGLGFGMGWSKFRWKYAPTQPEEFVQEVVRVYRKEWAPEVPTMWYALQDAALGALIRDTPHEAYGVEYSFAGGWLWARLPSGRKLGYFNPVVVDEAMPWDENDIRKGWTYQAEKQSQRKTIKAFGGLLTENICQALARDLLVEAMFKCEANDLPLIFTVHDENVTGPRSAKQDSLKVLTQIMEDRPAWATEIGVPVAVECWQGDRYRK